MQLQSQISSTAARCLLRRSTAGCVPLQEAANRQVLAGASEVLEPHTLSAVLLSSASQLSRNLLAVA
jgi:hypothetical protein